MAQGRRVTPSAPRPCVSCVCALAILTGVLERGPAVFGWMCAGSFRPHLLGEGLLPSGRMACGSRARVGPRQAWMGARNFLSCFFSTMDLKWTPPRCEHPESRDESDQEPLAASPHSYSQPYALSPPSGSSVSEQAKSSIFRRNVLHSEMMKTNLILKGKDAGDCAHFLHALAHIWSQCPRRGLVARSCPVRCPLTSGSSGVSEAS